MDTEHTQHAEKLTALVVKLTADLSAIAHYNEQTGDWEAVPDTELHSEADENAEADGVEEWNERAATVAALETEYRDAKRALEKLAAGTYGRCELCQEAIEEDRLAFRPTARTCKAHQADEIDLSL